MLWRDKGPQIVGCYMCDGGRVNAQNGGDLTICL